RQRAEMSLNIERQSFYKAREQKKLDEARAMLSRLPSSNERAVLLSQMATSYAGDGDKATALQLLAEAQASIGDRARDYGQLQAQVEIARAYVQLDPMRSGSIVETVFDQVNELSGAALVLSGFDLQANQYFRDGEFVAYMGTPLGNIIFQSSQVLGSMARDDFDNPRQVSDRLMRLEMRLMPLLQIAREALSSEAP